MIDRVILLKSFFVLIINKQTTPVLCFKDGGNKLTRRKKHERNLDHLLLIDRSFSSCIENHHGVWNYRWYPREIRCIEINRITKDDLFGWRSRLVVLVAPLYPSHGWCQNAHLGHNCRCRKRSHWHKERGTSAKPAYPGSWHLSLQCSSQASRIYTQICEIPRYICDNLRRTATVIILCSIIQNI